MFNTTTRMFLKIRTKTHVHLSISIALIVVILPLFLNGCVPLPKPEHTPVNAKNMGWLADINISDYSKMSSNLLDGRPRYIFKLLLRDNWTELITTSDTIGLELLNYNDPNTLFDIYYSKFQENKDSRILYYVTKVVRSDEHRKELIKIKAEADVAFKKIKEDVLVNHNKSKIMKDRELNAKLITGCRQIDRINSGFPFMFCFDNPQKLMEHDLYSVANILAKILTTKLSLQLSKKCKEDGTFFIENAGPTSLDFSVICENNLIAAIKLEIVKRGGKIFYIENNLKAYY